MDTSSLNSILQIILQNPAAIVGVIVPPIVDFINKDVPENENTRKFIYTLIACFGIATLLDLNKILINSWSDLIPNFILIFTESQVVYKLYFQNSSLRNTYLDRISAAPKSSNSPSPSEPEVITPIDDIPGAVG